MFSRINFIHIVKDHFKTLKMIQQSSNGLRWADYFLFILLPIIIAISLVYFNIELKNQLGNLIKAIAILGAFLFNLLAIIYNSIEKIKSNALQNNDKLKERYAKEIHTNISFNILLSIILLSTLVSYGIVIENFPKVNLAQKILSGTNYFFLILFGLTLLMNLNRIYILLRLDE